MPMKKSSLLIQVGGGSILRSQKAVDGMTAEDSDQEAGYAPIHHEGADSISVCFEKFAKEDRYSGTVG